MLHQYFAEITAELLRKSERIRSDFSAHNPSAGSNREALVGDLLREYLPKAFEIGTGLVFANNGQFSNQADLLIVDRLSNAPLYGTSPESIWLVEAIFALMEVKTQLTPTTIKDSVAKCVRFKSLPRKFGDNFGRQKLAYSLFILWSFESPTHPVLKDNIAEALKGIPLHLRPDFIVVPGHSITRSGSYLKVSTHGTQADLHTQIAEASGAFGSEPFIAPGQLEMLNTGSSTLLVFLIWLLSWLSAAGPRRAELVSYVPNDHAWGTRVS